MVDQEEETHVPVPGKGAPMVEIRGLRTEFQLPGRKFVVHDKLDIPFDSVRLKRGGGHGGHNGLRDIIAATGSPEFTRVRVGIGRPPGRQPAADFVLRDFASSERAILPNLLADAAEIIP